MLDDGTGGDVAPDDGLHTAVIPGQAAGVGIAFYVRALDQRGAESRFPDDAPARELMVRFGEAIPFGAFGTYRFWLTQSIIDQWTQREKLSNQALDTTFIHGQYRAIYNVGVRYRGSPFIRPNYTGPMGQLCAYVFETPRDDRLLGSREFNLDWLEQPGRDNTFQREKTSFWIADQLNLPSSHQAYIQLYVNGLRRGVVYTDSQQPNSDYIAAWFPERDNGEIFKIDDWFEFNASVEREFNVDATLQDFVTTDGLKKQARYRWNWEKKSNGGLDDDYSRLFDLVDALNTPGAANYTAAVESIVDVEQWMRVFALRHIVGDWDGYGYRRGKNQFAYKPPADPWVMLLWDLDFSLGGGSDSPTHDLYQTSDPTVSRMYNHPPFRRAYLRALHDAAHGPLLPERMDPILDATYAAFRASQLNVTPPAAVKSWVAERRAYILNHLAQFAVPLAITSNGGNDFSTDNPLLTLEGTAPVNAHTLRLNDVVYPLDWNTPTAWRLRLPLQAGDNLLTLEGFDSQGQPVVDESRSITITFTGVDARPEDHLVINEIMYLPLSPNAEFIELHNTSLTHAFDLSRHRLAGVDFNFPDGAIINPGGFAVVAANRAAFGAAYGSQIPVVGEYPGRLQPAGELLRLIRLADAAHADQVLTHVSYGNQPPWPTSPNGTGASLQLIDPNLDNHRVGNWAALADPEPPPPTSTLVEMTQLWRYNQTGADLGTAWRNPDYSDAQWPTGRALLYVEASPLPAPKNTPLNLGHITYYFRTTFNHDAPPTARPSLKLTTIIDDGAVFYLNGAEVFRLGMPPGTITASTFASRTVGNAALEGPFELPVDALLSGQNVLAVEAHQVNSGSSDIVFGAKLDIEYLAHGAATPGAPNSVRANLPPFPPVWINEILPHNASGPRDNAGEPDPWVEIYNAGATNVPLAGLHLTDDYGQLARWSFPADAVIAPGQFLVVWLDGQPQQSTPAEPHANFRIGPGAGSIALTRTTAAHTVVLDYLDFEALPEDVSFGRVPDGAVDAWRYLAVPSPGASNPTALGLEAVRINEWMASNTRTIAKALDGPFDDWFELHNPANHPIDLTGCTLTDKPNQPDLFVIPPGYTIPPGGFLLVWADDQPSQNGLNQDLHVNFKLDKAGEFIGLFAPDGRLIDQVLFGHQTDDVSQGRHPDGAESIVSFPEPTVSQTRLETPPRFIRVREDFHSPISIVARERHDPLLTPLWTSLAPSRAPSGPPPCRGCAWHPDSALWPEPRR
jgi:hypothetical protein